MLKTIERVTKRPIPIAKVPTVDDLRARRLELTRSALREVIEEEDLDHYRVVVESLADEFDLVEVALAAVKLAHDANGAPPDDEEIPDVSIRFERGRREGRGRYDRYGRDDRYYRDDDEGREGRGGDRYGRPPVAGMTRLFVGAGREAGIRPQDLVGAIAGESGLAGREIGAIDIAPRFSLVDVPDSAADDVIAALRGSTIKGKRVTIRREREQGR
ncbi:MAG: DbpA RNA binding domain-containing protein, partial [Acidimicrobiaceae bacterium]|nr:DbpA RNA binding domain-containing protein [Acidimicrobiaceae bacterium]